MLVDLDNTVADLYGTWLGVYNEEYAQDIKIEDITTWDIHEHIPHGGQIYKYLEQPGFYRTLKPIPGAISAVEAIMDAVNVIICTAAHAEIGVASDKMWWLRYHMPFISVKDIIFAYHKDMVRANALVDDGPHNITKYKAAWPDAKIWTLRWPYNGHLSHVAEMYKASYYTAEAFWAAFVPDVLAWAAN